MLLETTFQALNHVLEYWLDVLERMVSTKTSTASQATTHVGYMVVSYVSSNCASLTAEIC